MQTINESFALRCDQLYEKGNLQEYCRDDLRLILRSFIRMELGGCTLGIGRYFPKEDGLYETIAELTGVTGIVYLALRPMSPK